MPDTIIKWTDPNSIETGYDLYSSATPILDNALPVPLELAANTVQYIDTSLNLGDVRNYRVGTKYNELRRARWISANKKFTAGNLDMYMDFTNGFMYDHFTQDTPTQASRITDTGSAGMIPDASGNYILSPANTLSVTNDGLRTNPTRTNLIPNNSNQGVVAGTPGTFPTGHGVGMPGGMAKISIGVDSYAGLPLTIVRMAGTPTANPGAHIIQPSGLNGSPVVAGSTYTVKGLLGFDILSGAIGPGINGGVSLRVVWHKSDGSVSSVTGQTDRALTSLAFGYVSNTVVAPSDAVFASVQFRIGFNLDAAVDYTVTYGAFQFELGAFATDPILTTGTAVTRTGNRQVTDLTGRMSQGVAGFIEYDLLAVEAFKKILSFFNNSLPGNNFLKIGSGSTASPRLELTIDGVAQASSNGATPVAGVGVAVFAVGPGFQAIRKVGGVQYVSSLAYPNGLNQMQIGGAGALPNENAYQSTKKLALKFGPQNQASFDAMYALALTA